jgi:hypothetical protein
MAVNTMLFFMFQWHNVAYSDFVLPVFVDVFCSVRTPWHFTKRSPMMYISVFNMPWEDQDIKNVDVFYSYNKIKQQILTIKNVLVDSLIAG